MSDAAEPTEQVEQPTEETTHSRGISISWGMLIGQKAEYRWWVFERVE
jgi:hypothetical protein